MMILLSPSKSIHYQDVQSGTPITTPQFEDQASVLAKKAQSLGKKLGPTLGISEALAELNRARYDKWQANAKPPEGERAAWAFRGEVYFGLSAESLNKEQLAYADEHLRILSGLYGLLKITDGIMPHRLEMSTRLAGPWGKNLYDFWGDTIAKELIKSNPTFILNCASKEYVKVVEKHLPASIELIAPRFLHHSSTGLKPKMAFAKWSRGLMARWVIEQQPNTIEDLKKFNIEGYVFSEEHSKPNEPAFIAPTGFTLKGRYTKT